MSGVWKKQKGKIISFLAGIAIAALTAAAQMGNYESPSDYRVRILCDACFVAAVFLIGLGGLAWISTAGGFYHISYLFSVVKDKFLVPKKKFEQRKSYTEYVLEKKTKEKARYPVEMIEVGILYLILSLALAFAG